MKKITTIVVFFMFLACFVLTDARSVVDIDAPYDVPEVGELQLARLDVDTFTIPAHLGEIKYKFKGDPRKVVIHIQDAHCNHFAQKKIADIIDYLNREYGIKTVNLEGGVEEYDLSVFTSITGKAIRQEVANHFLKKGEINGAEFFAVNNPDKVQLWGVEDKDLYLANLKVYRDSLAHKEEVDEYMKGITHVINNLKLHIYDGELLKMDMNYNAYKEKNMQFREYLEFLLKKAQFHEIDMTKYQNLNLLEKSIEQEEAIDFETASNERKTLIDELKKNVSKADLRNIVQMTVDYKTKRITPKAFYTYLLDKAKDEGIDVNRFPVLAGYIEYVSTFESVDRFKIMKELDDMEAEIKKDIYQNNTQKELDTLSRNLVIMKNIFDIRLNKTDYDYYLENEVSFDAINFLEFIDREAPRYRITARPDPEVTRLDVYREDLSQFFEFSFQRDEVFLRNMKYSRVADGIQAAILMTGGFHTENLCVLLQEDNISYVSILPRFTMDRGYVSPYFDILAGDSTGIQEVLRSVFAQQAAMLQVPAKMSPKIAGFVFSATELAAFRASVQLTAMMLMEAGDRGMQTGQVMKVPIVDEEDREQAAIYARVTMREGRAVGIDLVEEEVTPDVEMKVTIDELNELSLPRPAAPRVPEGAAVAEGRRGLKEDRYPRSEESLREMVRTGEARLAEDVDLAAVKAGANEVLRGEIGAELASLIEDLRGKNPDDTVMLGKVIGRRDMRRPYTVKDVLDRLRGRGFTISEDDPIGDLEELQRRIAAAEMGDVRFYTASLGDTIYAQSYRDEAGVTHIILNSDRGIAGKYLRDREVLARLGAHERLEADKANLGLDHAMVEHLEVIANGYSGMTPLSGFILDKEVARFEDLDDIGEIHDSDPDGSFYMGNYLQRQIYLARDMLGHTDPKGPPVDEILEISEEEMLRIRPQYERIGNAAGRYFTLTYGPRLRLH
ncbi:MAG: hypothetical protein WBC00_01410, partial [Candidatus Omnitrophota bacterium]